MTAHLVSTNRNDVAARIASIEGALGRHRPSALDRVFANRLESARSLDPGPERSPLIGSGAGNAPLALGAAVAMALRDEPAVFEAARPSIGVFNGRGSEFSELFAAAGARHGVDPGLLRAVAEVESGFNPSAVSSAGAQGLMQFMPATAAEFGVDAFDPASAIDGAARYLAKELDRFGDPKLAIAAYNAGAGAVRRHGGVPPFAETQAYVQKVQAAWEQNR